MYENEEVNLLREALIDKHNKLLKELEVKKIFEEKLEHLEDVVSSLEKDNNQLLEKIDDLEYEREKQFRSLEVRNEEKCRSVEGRLTEEGKRNGELKKDLDAMRHKMLEASMNNNKLEEITN